MKRHPWLALAVVAFLFLGAAQAQVTLSVAEHPEFGTYLTDGEGMTLYLFVQDAGALATPAAAEERMIEGVREAAAECTGGCLDNWPPLLAEGGEFTIASEAEGQLDPELLYVADVDGRSQLVYNGWPLYYFANDTQAGDVNGQGVGDRWFVVAPEGTAAGEVAGGGEAETPDAEEDGAADGMDGEPADGMDQEDGQDDAGMDGAGDGDTGGTDGAVDGDAGAGDAGAGDAGGTGDEGEDDGN